MTVMAPKDENELRHMLTTALCEIEGPVAIRYPRGAGVGEPIASPLHALPIGRGETIRSGSDVAILALGSMVLPAERAAELLAAEGIAATVVNARFVKPLDERLVLELAGKCSAIVTVEENVVNGGFGSAVLELLHRSDMQVPARVLGIPDKVFEHAAQGRLRQLAGLSPEHIAAAARQIVTLKHSSLPGELLASSTRVG
jgi:1-deoxy-D-xylulose-5-phosphate synthase